MKIQLTYVDPHQDPDDEYDYPSQPKEITLEIPLGSGNGVELVRIPAPMTLEELNERNLPQPPEIIEGVLRKGSKLAIIGKPKARKSFCAIQLAIALASGRKWLGFNCKPGKVLYIDTELSEPDIRERFDTVIKTLGLKYEELNNNLEIWGLRGSVYPPLKNYVPYIVEHIKENDTQTVIIDPIYKFFDESENNQEVVSAFCNAGDKCGKAGAAFVYTHHEKKGNAGDRAVEDAGSGSNVFTRDADAVVQLVQLYNSGDEPIDPRDDQITAWRARFMVRSFRTPRDKTLLFKYPIHFEDTGGLAKNAKLQPSQKKSGDKKSPKQLRQEELKQLYEEDPQLTLAEAAEYFGNNPKTIERDESELGIKLKRTRQTKA